MKKEHEEESRNHMQSFKFKNYTFEERFKFINLYRRVLTFNCVFEEEDQYYPVVLFQDPYEARIFIICVMPYKEKEIALEFTEGSQPNYRFSQLKTRMNTSFSHATFYHEEGKPIDTREVYRLFWLAMKHDIAEESLEEWAERLEKKEFYPVTDELTDKFVAGRITYDYEPG